VSEEPFEWVEIDLPKCSRVYGTAPCTAALSASKPHKCFNLRATCQDPDNFLLGTPITLKFSKEGVPLPNGFKAFPVLSGVRQSSTTANIGGADPRYGALGRQATLDFNLADFTHHERGIDPYANERVTGAAQFSGVGYRPEDRLTFLAKLKARWPNYAAGEVRLGRAFIVNGAITDQSTYHHLLKEIAGPTDGSVRVSAYGILDLMNGKTAVAPKPSRGALTAAMGTGALSLTVTPVGIGNATYAASGLLTIGSEVMGFTRSGDVFTVTRGQKGTAAVTHSAGDTVQQAWSCTNARLDDVANELITDFTTTPSSWVPVAEWEAEVTRWGASIRLTTVVTSPTPVGGLLGELSDLGCNIIPDERAAEIRLRMNRPADGETIYSVTDENAYEITQEDREEDRVTQVYFVHRRADPTKGLGRGDDVSNYLRRALTVNADAVAIYGDVRTRTIRTRWLDQGDDTTVAIVSWQLLRRFEQSPMRVKCLIDARDKAILLGDVVELRTDDMASTVGELTTRLMQVIGRSEPIPYHNVQVELQRFEFNGRFGFITPNTYPVYGSATDAEKAAGAWIVDEGTLQFPDGTGPYRII
jgi:hypothetical protein